MKKHLRKDLLFIGPPLAIISDVDEFACFALLRLFTIISSITGATIPIIYIRSLVVIFMIKNAHASLGLLITVAKYTTKAEKVSHNQCLRCEAALDSSEDFCSKCGANLE